MAAVVVAVAGIGLAAVWILGNKQNPTAAVPAPTNAPPVILPAETRPAPTSVPPTRDCSLKFREPMTVLSIQTDGNLDQMAPGDFNGDSLTDFVAARLVFQTAKTFPIDILLNQGNRDFVRATDDLLGGDIPKTQHPREIVVADFNNDGRDDFFIADHGQDTSPFPGYQNTLVLSTPDGKMTNATSSLPLQSDFTHSAATADIDRDDDLDLYVGNIYGGRQIPPQILLNDGTGKLTAVFGRLPDRLITMQSVYTASLFADVNHDSFPDLILGGDQSAASLLLLNDGRGYFLSIQNLPSKPMASTDIALDIQATDLNGDSNLDLLLVYTKVDYRGRYIQILINNSDSTFRDETSQRLPQSANNQPWITFLDLVDLDADSHLDLVAHILGADRPLFYKNDGAGNFASLSLNLQVFDARFLFFFGQGEVLMSTSAYDTTPEMHFLIRPGCP
ncbi:MAG: FG-GAP repeat domain-containing protein [Chloroflexota bacterium]